MSEDLIQFDSGKAITRVAMVIALLLALFGSWIIVRAYIGNTMAEYFDSDDAALGNSRTAVRLAPRDPFTHWKLAALIERKLPADQLPLAVSEYEKAVSLSPNDYRFWMDFGVALEHAGQVERAEKALRHSVELAPSYAYPRWYLGNLLLRSGRYEDAFTELRRASESDVTFQPQLFNAAWAVFSDDPESLKKAVGSTATARAGFAQYLIGFQRFDDGIRLWKSLSEPEMHSNREAGESIVKALVAVQRYHDAASVSNDLVPAQIHSVEGAFVDGNFESGLSYRDGSIFGWKVKSTPQAQIGLDLAEGYQSDRSLRILFQVRAKLDSIDVSQVVPVAPDAQYDLEYAIRTSKLESADLPVLVIVDEIDGKVLATSAPAGTGTIDWKVEKFSFKTGPKTQAINLRIQRATCAPDSSCPIYGTIWYDNFNLQRRG